MSGCPGHPLRHPRGRRQWEARPSGPWELILASIIDTWKHISEPVPYLRLRAKLRTNGEGEKKRKVSRSALECGTLFSNAELNSSNDSSYHLNFSKERKIQPIPTPQHRVEEHWIEVSLLLLLRPLPAKKIVRKLHPIPTPLLLRTTRNAVLASYAAFRLCILSDRVKNHLRDR